MLMNTTQQPTAARWAGRAISVMVVLFLVADGLVALLRPDLLQEAAASIGFAPTSSSTIGIIALTCAFLYALPQTAMLGAVLTTAFLGGAVAAHVRVSPSPLTPEIIPAMMVGILAWLGLWLRSPRLRALLPLIA